MCKVLPPFRILNHAETLSKLAKLKNAPALSRKNNSRIQFNSPQLVLYWESLLFCTQSLFGFSRRIYHSLFNLKLIRFCFSFRLKCADLANSCRLSVGRMLVLIAETIGRFCRHGVEGPDLNNRQT